MPQVVTITFEGNHKKYYFGAIEGLVPQDFVVVETIRGLEIGKVVDGEKNISDEEVVGELKTVIRKATEKDLEDNKANKALKPSILLKVKERVVEDKLDMKVLDCDYTLDKTKLIIYFTAEQRIDFRELVKELAYLYKTRIELRQIGPRDASKIIGGIGVCGRKICCASFLGDIQNVTIKMAKNQNLTLNPNTISGLCGKLLCCISFEDRVYSDLKEQLPQVGDVITTEKGDGTVSQVNLIDETVVIVFADNTSDTLSLSDLSLD